MITRQRETEFQVLRMELSDQLAANCPRCFGPSTGETTAGEPDIILALDGNFSHKRMTAASVPISGLIPKIPELFMDPSRVQKMAETLGAAATRPNDRGGLVVCNTTYHSSKSPTAY